MFKRIFVIGLLGITFSGIASAQTKSCDQLTGEKLVLAKKILSTQHPYSCCDSTISKCLEKKNPCPIAILLANSICNRVARGENENKILRALSTRAKSMNPYAQKAKIDINGIPVAGVKTAPVTLVVYACARCPFCSKLVPQLYDAVTTGKLKGKVKLYFKPFPLKSHEYSKEGGLAMVAAIKLGHFWNYLIRMYTNFDMFCVDKLSDWAELEGMDPTKFKLLMTDKNVRNELIASKKEGLAIKVTATPQLFINGRKYFGFLDLNEVTDVLNEEYQRLKSDN